MDKFSEIRSNTLELFATDNKNVVKVAGTLRKLKNIFKRITDPEYKESWDKISKNSKDIKGLIDRLKKNFKELSSAINDGDVEAYNKQLADVKEDLGKLIPALKEQDKDFNVAVEEGKEKLQEQVQTQAPAQAPAQVSTELPKKKVLYPNQTYSLEDMKKEGFTDFVQQHLDSMGAGIEVNTAYNEKLQGVKFFSSLTPKSIVITRGIENGALNNFLLSVTRDMVRAKAITEAESSTIKNETKYANKIKQRILDALPNAILNGTLKFITPRMPQPIKEGQDPKKINIQNASWGELFVEVHTDPIEVPELGIKTELSVILIDSRAALNPRPNVSIKQIAPRPTSIQLYDSADNILPEVKKDIIRESEPKQIRRQREDYDEEDRDEEVSSLEGVFTPEKLPEPTVEQAPKPADVIKPEIPPQAEEKVEKAPVEQKAEEQTIPKETPPETPPETPSAQVFNPQMARLLQEALDKKKEKPEKKESIQNIHQLLKTALAPRHPPRPYEITSSFTEAGMATLLQDAYIKQFGKNPTAEELGMAWAQVVLEMGRSDGTKKAKGPKGTISLPQNNIGNINATPDWLAAGKPYFVKRTGEYDKENKYYTYDAAWRAYDTPEESAQNYWQMIGHKFEPAFKWMRTGDVESTMAVMGLLNYYTASIEKYVGSTSSLYKTFLKKILPQIDQDKLAASSVRVDNQKIPVKAWKSDYGTPEEVKQLVAKLKKETPVYQNDVSSSSTTSISAPNKEPSVVSPTSSNSVPDKKIEPKPPVKSEDYSPNSADELIQNLFAKDNSVSSIVKRAIMSANLPTTDALITFGTNRDYSAQLEFSRVVSKILRNTIDSKITICGDLNSGIEIQCSTLGTKNTVVDVVQAICDCVSNGMLRLAGKKVVATVIPELLSKYAKIDDEEPLRNYREFNLKRALG